jgi:hypothetical protein
LYMHVKVDERVCEGPEPPGVVTDRTRLFQAEQGEFAEQRVVATGTATGVAEIFQGSLAGTVRPGGERFANWRTIFHPNGAITAQIGGVAADGRLPAVVVKGSCKGPFASFEADLPLPEEGAAAQRVAAQRVGWGHR